MQTKVCSKCKIEKFISEFEFRKDSNKYRNQCKLCVKKRRNGWEIDHIRPCISFDLSKSEEQKRCFGFQNLQPL